MLLSHYQIVQTDSANSLLGTHKSGLILQNLQSPALTQKPLLESLSEVQRPGAGKQILPGVLQFRVVVPDALSGVALGDHLQGRVPSLRRTNESD